MEYLFKKDEMLELITNGTDSNTVVISVNFKAGDQKGVFVGEILARLALRDPATGTQVNSKNGPGTIIGCPNPPGC